MREGSKNGNARLTEAEVVEIRRLYKEKGVKQKDLAKRYHVSQQSISLITTGVRWSSSLCKSKHTKSEEILICQTYNKGGDEMKDMIHNLSKEIHRFAEELDKFAEEIETKIINEIHQNKEIETIQPELMEYIQASKRDTIVDHIMNLLYVSDPDFVSHSAILRKIYKHLTHKSPEFWWVIDSLKQKGYIEEMILNNGVYYKLTSLGLKQRLAHISDDSTKSVWSVLKANK